MLVGFPCCKLALGKDGMRGMTNLELRSFLAARDLRGLREACGFGLPVVAAALGVPAWRVADWETRGELPGGPVGARYARVVAGMERHLEVKTISDEKTGAGA